MSKIRILRTKNNDDVISHEFSEKETFELIQSSSEAKDIVVAVDATDLVGTISLLVDNIEVDSVMSGESKIIEVSISQYANVKVQAKDVELKEVAKVYIGTVVYPGWLSQDAEIFIANSSYISNYSIAEWSVKENSAKAVSATQVFGTGRAQGVCSVVNSTYEGRSFYKLDYANIRYGYTNTPFLLSNTSHDSANGFATALSSNATRGIQVNAAETKIVIGTTLKTLSSYTMSTARNVTTAALTQTYTFSSYTNFTGAWCFSNDNETDLYVCDGATVRKYSSNFSLSAMTEIESYTLPVTPVSIHQKDNYLYAVSGSYMYKYAIPKIYSGTALVIMKK